jgi:hypothetical protein
MDPRWQPALARPPVTRTVGCPDAERIGGSERGLGLEHRDGLGKRGVGRLRVIARPNVAPEGVLGFV